MVGVSVMRWGSGERVVLREDVEMGGGVWWSWRW